MRKKQIVVIGASDDYDHNEEAYIIGEYIAQRGHVLITGGRSGIMEAVSRGVHDHGGIAVGILPGEDLDDANEYCNIVIPSGIGYARNVINVLSADIIIAIGGKSGTLTELAYAWQFNKPVICCTFAGGWSVELADRPIDNRPGSRIFRAESAGEVIKILEKYFT